MTPPGLYPHSCLDQNTYSGELKTNKQTKKTGVHFPSHPTRPILAWRPYLFKSLTAYLFSISDITLPEAFLKKVLETYQQQMNKAEIV